MISGSPGCNYPLTYRDCFFAIAWRKPVLRHLRQRGPHDMWYTMLDMLLSLSWYITINIDTGKGVQVTDFKAKGLTSDQVHGHLREFHGHGWWNHVKWWASPLHGTVGPGQKVQSFANSHQFPRVSGWTIETGFAHCIRSPHLSETFRENCQNIPLAVSWKLHLRGSTAPQRILVALA